MKPAREGFVDFIAIEFDKYDVWDAFIQPMPVREEMYFKPDYKPEYIKLARASPPSSSCDGGIDNTECVVPGTQTQQGLGPAQPSFGNSDPGTGHQDPGSDPGYGIGGGGLTEEQMECSVEKFLEEDIDKAAQNAAADIMTRSDWRSVEYGALIYDGPNGIRVGEIFRGDSRGVPIVLRPFAGETVVGRIHSHPRGAVGAPSDDDDREGRDFLINNGHTDGSTFVEYILDGNNRELNEFDNPEDMELDEPNDETRDDAQGDCSNV